MEKSVQITTIIVAGIVILGVLGYLAMSNLNPTSNTVTGNGQATVKAIPDIVSVYFNVETSGSTSQEATDKNSDIVNKLKDNLVSQGFTNDEIQTISFNVYPDYSWGSGTQKLIGYKASHSIKVELPTSDSGKIGTIIDSGVNAGAGISYINFELSQEKQNQYKSEALKLAAQDSKIKAESIAEGLGKKLGSLVSTTDSNFNYNPWRLYDNSASSGGGMAESDVAMAKQATTNIQPGEQDIYASVTATYRLR